MAQYYVHFLHLLFATYNFFNYLKILFSICSLEGGPKKVLQKLNKIK